MSIVQWNCRGILSSTEQLKIIFRDSQAKVICLQETKLGNRQYNPGLNYSYHTSQPQPNERAQGGTGFIVHRSVKCDRIQLHTELQASAIQITLDKKITLCSLYLEPRLEDRLFDTSGNNRQLNINDLQNLVDQLPAPFILMGDFNAKSPLWGNSVCDRWGSLVEQFIDVNEVILLNDGSKTRHDIYHHSSSAIDLTICSAALALDYQWSVDDDLHGSDHWPIHLRYINNIPSPCPPKWKIEEADWDEYEKSAIIESKCDDFPSPIHAYEYLCDNIEESAEKNIPKTSGLPRRPVVPWWNKDCAVARKITRTCFRRFNRSRTDDNRIAYARACAKQKRIFKKAKRSSWLRYISEITSKTPNSQIWKKIKKLQGKFVPNPLPILKVNGNYITEPKEVAEVLGKHFANISSVSQFSPEFQQIRRSTIVTPPPSNNTEAFNIPFTMDEMLNALNNSKLTSPGEDGIRYEMIRHLPEASKFFLLDTLNGLWVSHKNPKSWKISEIVPAFKPGKDPENPRNYRPIALTSCICKLFERMVNNRLVWYLETKNLLTNRQFGFRKNCSTLDPLLMISREIQNAFAVQNQVFGVFFDLEKAYDTTWRNGILKQLASWGIGGNMFAFLNEFLTDRYLKVRVGSVTSSLYLQEEGVPQGSVLSVTLFAVAINSLIDHIPAGVQGSLFVDDFVIYCSGSTAVEACRKVQTAINKATEWADARGFKFSPQKTKAIRFTRTRKNEEIPTLLLNGNILPLEEEVKFLGVILDQKLTFGPHIKDLASRVKESLNILKVVSHFDWGADRKTLIRLYTTLCLSKIDYACQIYGSACKTNLEKLDVVHNMGLRICTGAYRTSPLLSLYVDSGLPPLSIRREELSLRYLGRSLTSKKNPNYKYVKAPVNRAVNKPRLPKPLEVRYMNEIRDIGLSPITVAEVKYPQTPPWCQALTKVCTVAGGKSEKSDEIMKREFLEHASKHKGHAIYTDGAKTPDGVACAFVADEVIVKKRLPDSCSVFTAETYAILNAVKYIFNVGSYDEWFIIYSDSLSVLFSLKQLAPSHHLVQEVQDWLVLLHSRKRINVRFCWVPAHVGIAGNEKADRAAKQAVSIQNISNINIPYRDFKEPIHNSVREKWQSLWNDQVNNKLKSIRPFVNKWESSNQANRRASVVLTRLRIGHTHVTHSYLLKSGEERQTPICEPCQAELTVKHILIDCPVFNYERRAASLHGRSLSEVLGNNCNVGNLISFLKKIDYYYRF